MSPSHVELLAQALHLVRCDLLRNIPESGRHQAVFLVLREHLQIDDALAKRTTTEVAARRSHSPRSAPFDLLDPVCNAMFELRHGLPHLCTTPSALRLSRVVDPDALAPLHPELDRLLDDDEPFDWPSLPHNSHREGLQILAHGSLDSHIHLGGALPPLYYWLPLMSGAFPFRHVRGMVSPEHGHAPWLEWAKALARAAWLRCWLARWIDRHADRHTGHCFPWLAGDWHTLVGELETQDLSLLAVQDRLFRLRARLRRPRRRAEDPVRYDDPFREGVWGQEPVHPAAGERRLLYRVAQTLRRLQRDSHRPSEVAEAAHCLSQYLGIRNSFYIVLVYDWGSDGLARMDESFKRRGFLTRRPGKIRWTSRRRRRNQRETLDFERYRTTAALETHLYEPFTHQGPAGILAAQRGIELRVALDPGTKTLRTIHAWLAGLGDFLQQHRRQLGQAPPYPVGFVVHWLKLPGRNNERTATAMARRLTAILREYPDLRPYFVGVDSAGQERAAPPREFLDAYAIIDQLTQTHRAHSGEPPIRLGYTYHVGEDAWDLLTALRHVDEVVTLLLPERGARIGHGLALGESPARFYQRRGGFSEPRLSEHLLDLVWAWGRCREAGWSAEQAMLEAKIAQLGSEWQESELNKEDCWQDMGLNPQHMGRDRRRRVRASEADLLQKLKLVRRADAPPPSQRYTNVFPIAAWLDLLERLQAQLRHQLAQRGICIEANPSSNLLVGGYSHFHELPYRRFVDDGLPVSLNTDDPGMFVTTLPQELQRLYDAYLPGSSHTQVLDWLAARCAVAERYTFLGPDTPRGEAACEQLRFHHLGRLFRHHRSRF